MAAPAEMNADFRLADALMYGGQGKTDKVLNDHCNTNLEVDAPVDNGNTGEWAGLQPPHLATTGGVVCGNSK
jgi:hypothetical protein